MYHEGRENQMHTGVSTFLQHEKVYSDDRFLVKVRSCGHFLVSAKPVT